MPSLPSLPQKWPYLASLLRQNSLTFEHAWIGRQNAPWVQQNEPPTSALQQYSEKSVFFCAISTIQQPPSPFPSFQRTPLPPHPQPHRRSPVAWCCPSAWRAPWTTGISAAWHICGLGSLWDAYSWGDSRSERGVGLFGGHQESWKKSDPPASSPWAVMARSTLPARQRSTPFLEYTSSWTGCVHKYNHPQISLRLGYKAAFWRHALQSSLEGLAGGSAALSAHDPFWLSSRIMTPAAWVI